MEFRWMVLVSALAAAGCQDVGSTPPTISADGGSGGGGGGSEACEGPLGAPIFDFSGMEACCSDENGPYGEGHCLSDCLEFGLPGIAIKQGDCADDYRCAPCVNPLSGEATGAPGCPATL